jgi:GWxTD domain-containing protein
MRTVSWRFGAVAGLGLGVLLMAAAAGAAWLRPLESGGNFLANVDLANLYGPDGQLDVVVMVAVENRELSLDLEGGRYRGELEAKASLTSPDGQTVEARQTFKLLAQTTADAQSATLCQIFTLVLPDVPFASGTFALDLRDQKRKRPAVFSVFSGEKARSELLADWAAPESAAAEEGLTVGDAVYLANAPVKEWLARGGRPLPPGEGGPWDYLHPLRRYGVELTRIQVYFNVLPPAGATARAAAARDDLLIEVLSKDLDFALHDTLSLTPPVREALAAGRPAAVYYELDGSLLPPGSFRLGIAPLAGTGRGLLGEFDVSWRLDRLARGSEVLAGEGRVVFAGDRLDRYIASTRAEQEVMLEEFWQKLDPDPADPYNPVYAEFRRRIAYAHANLGGFDARGARDDRGLLYILLGPPDETRRETMPLNQRDQDDARIQVYKPEAPDREGTAVKGTDPVGIQGRSPWASSGGIPMPFSQSASNEMRENRASPLRDHGFELWTYTWGGVPLFPNQYSAAVPLSGLQLLFIDTDGTGRYRLDASNVTRSGD